MWQDPKPIPALVCSLVLITPLLDNIFHKKLAYNISSNLTLVSFSIVLVAPFINTAESSRY